MIKMSCIVCGEEIKPYEPGTCLHEAGWWHHLSCVVDPEFMDMIHNTRLQTLGEVQDLVDKLLKKKNSSQPTPPVKEQE